MERGPLKVPFFDENGFVRKKCSVCGEYFWTQNSEADNCGDAPCCEYTFIGNPPTRRRYSLGEMRDRFLRFFENMGHEVISPYPVVARWRDDLYVTIASIIDFQPYVTEGVIPPPANPLVISQPCLRFEDVDKVGPTAGRHMTIFEMGGHHAFNYPEKPVYWKDETVRLHHRFATEELGIKSELVSYKEGIWSGGGNAGRDLETEICGLEVATLVFMMYKVVNGGFVPLPIKTVDTGYGMERWCWLSQGSLSGFHAIYGTALDKILKMAGLKADEEILVESAKHSALMGAADFQTARRTVAEKIGVDAATLNEALEPIEKAYAITDYTKALVFMLAEGVVPSNVREGYLARLLARRAFRFLGELRIEGKLFDVIEEQIRYWSTDFPRLGEMRDEIVKMLEIERNKYSETLSRGRALVERMVRARKRILEGELVELYDSHGLLPELVKRISEKEGVKVAIPTDFYAKVAQRHQMAQPIEEEPMIRKLRDEVTDLPPTRMLYYEDSTLEEFEADVLDVVGDGFVVLNQTAFYPQGGGQPGDEGTMEFDDVVAKVGDVRKIGNVIVHRITGTVPRKGQRVKGKIDWGKRSSLMRFHTATHILMGAARRVLGEHVWQAGAQKGVKTSRLDLSHFSHLTQDEMERIEKLANTVVMNNVPVDTSWMPRQDAESTYGFRLYQGGVVPGREIRVVKIGDWDVEACGGTHCRSTGEVGLMKIVRATRIQDGVERLTFAAGMPALEFVQTDRRTLNDIAVMLDVPVEDVKKSVGEFIAGFAESRRELKRLMKYKAKSEAKTLLGEAVSIGEIKIVTHSTSKGSVDELIEIAKNIVREDEGSVAGLFVTNETAQAVVIVGKKALGFGIKGNELASRIGHMLGGSGGGDPTFGQAGGTKVAKVPEVVEAFKGLVRKQMES